MPTRSGLTTRKPTAGVGTPEDRLRQLEDQVASLSGRLSKLQGPGLRPQGPTSVTVTPVGTTNLISFRADVAEASGVGYRIWRAAAGTRSAPTTPSSSTATLIGAIPAIWSRPNAAEPYIWADRDFAISQLDPANPSRWTYWVSTATIDEESPKIIAAGSPVEVLTNGPGDQSHETKLAPLNKLWNTAFKSRATTVNLAVGPAIAVTNATNATPIVITTATAHGNAGGDNLMIRRVGGNLAANGIFVATTNINPTQFSLDGVAGTGAYTSGGIYYNGKGQVRNLKFPPGDIDTTNTYPWSPWFTDSGAPEFVSDGTVGNGEIVLKGASFGTPARVAQHVEGRKFKSGMHLTISAFLRAPIAPNDMRVVFGVKNLGSSTLREGIFDGSLITSTYKRFIFNVAIETGISLLGIDMEFRFASEVKAGGGTARDIYILRPMVAVGDVAPGWTGSYDIEDATPMTSSINDPQTPAWQRPVGSETVRDASAAYA